MLLNSHFFCSYELLRFKSNQKLSREKILFKLKQILHSMLQVKTNKLNTNENHWSHFALYSQLTIKIDSFLANLPISFPWKHFWCDQGVNNGNIGQKWNKEQILDILLIMWVCISSKSTIKILDPFQWPQKTFIDVMTIFEE